MPRRSAFLPLLFSVLALGIADSMIGPYLVLFGADEAGLSPLRVGIFMSLVSLSGLAVSTWLGRRYDRSASRWPALVAVVAPAVGYLALTTTSAYPLLLLVGVGLLGAGMAAFPQVFTLARTHLDRTGGAAVRRGTPALRSVWSLAWAVGPMVGAAMLALGGYDLLMVVTAAAFGLVAVPLALLGRTPAPLPPAEPAADGGRLSRPLLLAAGSFTLFHTAMLAGSVVLPLYVTRTLHQSDSAVGLLFSVCAIVEVPAALATMLLPARSPVRAIIVAGMVLFAGYFVLVSASATMPLLIATQVARGVALAVVGALGITYVQDLAPGATGRTTALYANTLTVGSLVSGVLAGATAQTLGYRPALLVCAGLAAAGCVLLAVSAVVRPRAALAYPG
ncbi:MFS transporter [Asanoa sp. WMMD1127]|uniref:MFS transporter n=1 Tax=Asanoa sp. WMMD1127 TaxID=3016107 RepID=UPI0024178B61|nr:MFS transporter [Asanoa sp. WMMD1127]MDG4827616.1 MFS transporter [Asanoa sp. WMMD1127]